jgi:hypothetical protein
MKRKCAAHGVCLHGLSAYSQQKTIEGKIQFKDLMAA